MPLIPILATAALVAFLLLARLGKGNARILGFVFAGALALAIAFGLIHGFGRVTYGHININGGKLVIACALAVLLPSPLRWSPACWLTLVVAITVLPLLAWWLGFAHFHPNLQMALLWFALSNFPTVVAEDFFFRRFVQDHLKGLGAPLEILLTAALFGLVHLPSGQLFAFLAFIAGLFYSATYRLAKDSVWAVCWVHSSVNLTRAVLFGIP